MQDLLKRLSRLQPGSGIRYGLPVLAVVVITLLRSIAPLDVAPFLLYMPLLFLSALALGRGAGYAALISSEFAAAYFFLEDTDGRFTTGEVVALALYALIGIAMVLICSALRRAFVDLELSLTHLNAANQNLEAGRVHLEEAREQAEGARESAEAANRAKSDFLANMSHELRTPLSAIIGYSEMMIEELEDAPDAQGLGPDIRKIEGNARHLLGLINDVLDLSKVESGKMEVYAETFEVASTLRDIAATVQGLIGKNENTLVLELAPDVGSMHSDLTKVRQLLLNLLSNAAKFTRSGTITLAAHRETEGGRDAVVFAVSDTGLGMTQEQVAKLFTRFQQADSSTTRKFGGTGLGLSLTRAFADMLGGTVDVRSAPGTGSTFTLTVPATYVEPEPDAGASSEPDVASADSAGKDLVLVIDDDPDQRALMTRFLHREGFLVRVASNGRAGLEQARTLRPRAILLDVMMPGVDGWSVLSQLKRDPELSDTPVVMVTAVDQRKLAASLGAADYLMKPVDWSRLGGVMERFRTKAGARPRALLVEDDAIIRLSLREALESGGWDVTEAANGQLGLEAAAAAAPDVVLVDLSMPVMDGFSFLKEFRDLAGCEETPVVVVTGKSLTAEDRRLLRGGSQVLNPGDLSRASLVERLQRIAEPQPAAP